MLDKLNMRGDKPSGFRTPWFVQALRVVDKLKSGNHAYATAAQMFGDGSEAAVYVPELEHSFFRAVRLANGTFKTTRAERLNDLNRLVERHLPSRRPLAIKDVAVSSGVSTVEWSEQLRGKGIEHLMTATDLTITAMLVSFTDQLRILFDDTGTIIQIDIAGYPVYPRLSGRLDSLLVGMPSKLAGRFTARQLATCMHRRPDSISSFVRMIELVTPRLRQSGIEVKQEDLMAPEISGRRWDVVRAANILNLGYFGPEVLRQMFEGLTSSLEVGGVLAVCRTEQDERNHGSVWRLQADQSLELAGRVGRGSEIEDLVRRWGSIS